jgi:hypothetical protein
MSNQMCVPAEVALAAVSEFIERLAGLSTATTDTR